MRQVTPPTATPSDGAQPEPPVQQSFDFNAPPRAPVRSPGPSRLVFRMKRMWKKAWVRRLVLAGLPLALLTGTGVRLALDPAVQGYFAEQRTVAMKRLLARPEFAIRGARVLGASERLEAEILAVVAVPAGASTLTYDVTGAQASVNRLPAVREAQVTLAPDGMLSIHVQERRPRVVWRDAEDRLWLLDIDGVAIGPAGARADHPDLPIILGEAADTAVAEALKLIATAHDLKPRIRALVRVGRRRWNVALDRGMTIMLPEDQPNAALARVMAWHRGPDKVLDRGLSHVDMRVRERPALRMTPRALELRPLDETLRDGTGEET